MTSNDRTPACTRVHIALGERSYPILIGDGLIDRDETWRPLASPRASALIVTNETVGPLYAERLQARLQPHFQRIRTLALPDGEAFKDWPHLNRIFDELLGAQADRKTV